MDQQQKVILIEDDEFIRELYVSEMQNAGLIAEGYATGNEGLKALDSNRYDLALLDIMLPDTNGLEILKYIKQNPAIKDLKCVILTNLGQEEVIQEGFALGAHGYMIKANYNPDQVIAKVKEYLKGRIDTPPTNI